MPPKSVMPSGPKPDRGPTQIINPWQTKTQGKSVYRDLEKHRRPLHQTGNSGGYVCRFHGGATPQVKKLAAARLRARAMALRRALPTP